MQAQPKKVKIYFWGTGNGCEKALTNFTGDAQILGFIDNNPSQHGKSFHNKTVISYQNIKKDFDYIIVTVKDYESVIYQLEKSKENLSKVLFYFDGSQGEETLKNFFDIKGWKIDILEERIFKLEQLLEINTSNMGYEIADKIRKEKYVFPILHSDEEAVNRIVNEHCSLIRFGDGEFEIMAGKNRAPFQNCDENLSEKLRAAVTTDNENILIAIADNYGDLDIYTEQYAFGIREYMTEEVRAFHSSVLSPYKVYYNAYMFKCYLPYKDKSGTQQRINLIKKIWNQRDVVLVEGNQTRTGQGNDLLDNAKSVSRILCPTKNAFTYYNEILYEVKKVSTENMILMALGPAGKVMACDLVAWGYQVIDIGQLDIDYEWYRAGKEMRVPVPTKYVAELPPAEIEEINDPKYANEIIAHIHGQGMEQI